MTRRWIPGRHRRLACGDLDRFLHHANIFSITGRSYRRKDRAAIKDRAMSKGQVDKDSVPEETACQE